MASNGTLGAARSYNEHGIDKESDNRVNGTVEVDSSPQQPVKASEEDIQLVLRTFRLLVADLCQQFNQGHAGGAMGMAAIGVALFKYTMKYAPHHPTWFNRDRFVLSNGHACLFQYINLHLTGYKAMTMEQLRSYHSGKADGICPGHPEIEHEGVELTTGPLGQGIAMAVGLAIATKHLAARYNRPGFEVVNNHTWCIVGDACLQEGVGCEAFSYAGHLKLNNLTVIYDNNQITCDGSVDLTNTEEINLKMRAAGWDVIDIMDGVNNVKRIVAALNEGRHPQRSRPLFVNVRTTIGVDSALEGRAAAHGDTLGHDDIERLKTLYGFDPRETFVIPGKVRKFYEDLPTLGSKVVHDWDNLVERYKEMHPELGKDFQGRMDGKFPEDWERWMPCVNELPPGAVRTNKSNALGMSRVFENVQQFLIGTADLTPSINLTWEGYQNFNPPSLNPISGDVGSYAGRYIHFGVREHLMVAVCNGMAAYSPGTILPITTTFLMFYSYAAAAVRMGALQHLHVIHVATHDSIGLGRDGPTHQPIEMGALFRAMPNMIYIRPADMEETAGAWKAAITHRNGPVTISVAREMSPPTGLTKREGVSKGAYVLQEASNAEVTLIGVGAELFLIPPVAKALSEQQPPITARIVSFPSHALFRAQTKEYQRSVLMRHKGIPAIVIEPYSSLGWERWADAGFTMQTYGHSLPAANIYQHFGYTTENMVQKIVAFVAEWKNGDILRGEWMELLNLSP